MEIGAFKISQRMNTIAYLNNYALYFNPHCKTGRNITFPIPSNMNNIWSKTVSVTSTVASSVSAVGSFLWDPLQYVTSYSSSKATNASNALNAKKQQTQKSFGKAGFLYAFVIDKKKNVYKVGKTVNVVRRTREYTSTNLEGYVVYYVAFDDMDHAERILHNILKLNGHHIEKEVFTVPEDLLKEYMNLVASLCGAIRRVKDVDKLRQMTQFLTKITN